MKLFTKEEYLKKIRGKKKTLTKNIIIRNFIRYLKNEEHYTEEHPAVEFYVPWDIDDKVLMEASEILKRVGLEVKCDCNSSVFETYIKIY